MRRFSGWTARQRLTLAALAGLSTWLLSVWIGLFLCNRLKELDRQQLVAQQQRARLEALAARQPYLEQQARTYASFLADGSDEFLQQAFFDELEQFAAEGGLQLNLKPWPIQRDGDVRRLGVELEVEATQGSLLAFLDRLFASSSLCELERLRIATAASAEYPLRATLVVSKVIIPR